MVTSPISSLPPEVLHQVIKDLPIALLLRFGQTSKRNYLAAISALQELRLAILPRHIHGVLAFLSSSAFEDIDADLWEFNYDDPCRNQIIIASPLPTPPNGTSKSKTKAKTEARITPAHHREKLIQLQNALACSILSTSSLSNLSSLTLHIYHMTSSSLTEILATSLPNLRELRLNFCHPYLHDTCLLPQYWTNPVYLEASPIWNALTGVGETNHARLRLRNLERLTVERAGITSCQLRKWVECNQRLQELKLRNVAGVDLEFIQWLGQYYGTRSVEQGQAKPAKLKALALEACSSLAIKEVGEFSSLDPLFDMVGKKARHDDKPPTLQVLSFRGSGSISTQALLDYLESTRPPVRRITLPDGRILVDKAHKRTRSHFLQQQSCPQAGQSGHKKQCRSRRPTPTLSLPLHVSSFGPNETAASSGVEADSVSTGIEALRVEADDDEDESTDDDSDSSSPVSYLRTISHCNSQRGCKYRNEDVIEPDPDAR